jgi:hypothetical protein
LFNKSWYSSTQHIVNSCSLRSQSQSLPERAIFGWYKFIHGSCEFVRESVLIIHGILVPPNACGTVTYVASAGSYNINVRLLFADWNNFSNFRMSFWKSSSLVKSSNLVCFKFDPCVNHVQSARNWQPTIHCFAVSVCLMPCFHMFKEVPLLFQELLFAEKVSSLNRCQSTRTQMISFTLVAVSTLVTNCTFLMIIHFNKFI